MDVEVCWVVKVKTGSDGGSIDIILFSRLSSLVVPPILSCRSYFPVRLSLFGFLESLVGARGLRRRFSGVGLDLTAHGVFSDGRKVDFQNVVARGEKGRSYHRRSYRHGLLTMDLGAS